MKNKKVLIISMTAGFGHIRAGDALLDYAKESLPGIHVEHMNVFDANPLFKNLFPKFYSMVSKKAPFIWGILYKISDFKLTSFLVRKISIFDWYSMHKIKNYVQKKNPNAIIFTSPFLVPVFALTCRKIFPDIKMGIVITDYYGHSYYNIPYIDYYFVANSQVQKDLENIGVGKEKIIVTGIPIDPKFYITQDIKELKLKSGINNDFPVVLLIASFKISKKDLIGTIRQLIEFEPKVNIICIANGNDEFYDIIKKNFLGQDRFLLINWTNVIEEYIKISDVVVSKAGGLTVSECISLQKPMIIINPIPGQEEHNAEFIEKNNFGVKVKKIDEIIESLPKMILLSKSNQMVLLLQKNPSEKIFQYMLR